MVVVSFQRVAGYVGVPDGTIGWAPLKIKVAGGVRFGRISRTA